MSVVPAICGVVDPRVDSSLPPPHGGVPLPLPPTLSGISLSPPLVPSAANLRIDIEQQTQTRQQHNQQENEEYQLYTHSFLPNLLRNWLWSRPSRPRLPASVSFGSRGTSEERRPSLTPGTPTTYATGLGWAPLMSMPAMSTPKGGRVSSSSSSMSPSTRSPLGGLSRPPTLRLGQRSLRKAQAAGGVSNPSSFKLEGAILFVDMSGFTPLSERLGDEGMIGVEALSRHLNDYFGPIVEMIESHGGDVIKFAGDAIMVLFAANPFADEETDSGSTPHLSLSDLVCQAVVCADAVHREFNEFSPCDGIVLKLHSAISAGVVYACVVGGAFDRYEFLLQGQPIFDLAPALAEAQVGQLMLTTAAYQLVRTHILAHEVVVDDGKLDPMPSVPAHMAGIGGRGVSSAPRVHRLRRTNSESPASIDTTRRNNAKHIVIVWRFEKIITNTRPPTHSVEAAVESMQRAYSSPVSASLSARRNSLSQSRGSFGQTNSPLPGGASPQRPLGCSSSSTAASFLIPGVLARVQDGQGEYLAEFRRVTTLFIQLPVLPTHSLDAATHTKALHELSNIVCTIMNITFASRGEIRQLITDDKGTVIICVFGLISHTHNPLRGLKAAADIVERLRTRGHAVNIGITTGQVFCGCIGTLHRCEYTFIGDRINTSARLMVACSKVGASILSDAETVRILLLGSSPLDSLFSDAPLAADLDADIAHTSHGIQYTRKAPLTLKGKSKPFPVWSIATAPRGHVQHSRVNSAQLGLEELAAVNTAAANDAPAHNMTLLTPPPIQFHRSSILHDLTRKSLWQDCGSDVQPAVLTDPALHDGIVGREFEFQFLKPRLMQACLLNGAAARRRKQKEAIAQSKVDASPAARRITARRMSTDTSTLSILTAMKLNTLTSPSECISSTKPPSHGIIFLESVAGFGRSAFMASLVDRGFRHNGLISPDYPWLDLHLESLVATADEFNVNVPYFTSRALIRCMLGSFYRLAAYARRVRAKEMRQQQARVKADEKRARKEARAGMRINTQPDGLTSVSTSSDSDSDSEFDFDPTVEYHDADTINLETYSFKDIALLGLPADLACMQHLHLLNEIVPGLKLPYIPPRRQSIRKFHRLSSMNEVTERPEEADTESPESNTSSDTDEDDEEDDEVQLCDDDDTRVSTSLAHLHEDDLKAHDQQHAVDVDVVADVHAGSSGSDTEILSPDESASSSTDSDDGVMSQSLRSMHPHLQPTASSLLQFRSPSQHLSRSISNHRRRSVIGIDGQVTASTSVPSSISPPSRLPNPATQQRRAKAKASRRSARKYIDRGEIEPDSFSVIVSPANVRSPLHSDAASGHGNTGVSPIIPPKVSSAPPILPQPDDIIGMSSLSPLGILPSAALNVPFSSASPTRAMSLQSAPPFMSAAAKSETIEATILELLSTLLDLLHAADTLTLLTSLPRRSNLALFIDNAQWLDASTLTLIQSIQRTLPSILMVISGRNFSRNLHITGRRTELSGTIEEATTAAGMAEKGDEPPRNRSITLETTTNTNSSKNAPHVNDDLHLSAATGNQLLRSAQQRGSIYIVRGDELQSQVNEKLAEARRVIESSSSDSHDDSDYSPDGAATVVPAVELKPDYLYDLDYFDLLPSHKAESPTPPHRAPTMAPSATFGQNGKAKSNARRRNDQAVKPIRTVEGDPARDFEK